MQSARRFPPVSCAWPPDGTCVPDERGRIGRAALGYRRGMPDQAQIVDPRPIVVCAIPIDGAARGRLAAMLGNVELVDVRDVVDGAAAVLAPPCSPQTLGALQRTYPSAKVVVVELSDHELRIELGGPVTRSLVAGAQGYLTASSLGDLASQQTSVEARSAALHDGTPLALEASSVDDLIMQLLEEREVFFFKQKTAYEISLPLRGARRAHCRRDLPLVIAIASVRERPCLRSSTPC